MNSDAADMIDAFLASYEGMFGGFTKDVDSSESMASASSPDGDNTSTVRFELHDDIIKEFDNRVGFIESKRKRLSAMGELESFECPCGFIRSAGVMLNFDLMGKSGGFFFYTAYKDNVLLFIQAYSTTGQGHISEEERTRIIKAAHKATRRLSVLSLYEITDGHD